MSKTGAPVQLLHTVYSPNFNTVQNRHEETCVYAYTFVFKLLSHIAFLFIGDPAAVPSGLGKTCFHLISVGAQGF